MTIWKKAVILSFVMILILSAAGMLAGCGEDDEPGSPVIVSYDVELYFINEEYAETGDENLPHYLIENREIQVPSEENLLVYVLEALKTPREEGSGTVVTDDVVFHRIYVSEEDKEVLVVDLKNIGGSGGSLQEGFFIGQIVETMLKNVSLNEKYIDITKVQFMVNSEKVESLMGHFDASEPFTSQF